jgi:hypothetical protein
MHQLPNVERAVVENRKITDYLLSVEHPFGRAKMLLAPPAQARFFRRFGFRLDVRGLSPAEAWQTLQSALLDHTRHNAVVLREATPFGMKYVIEGPLVTPDGRNPVIRAVWFVETGHERPRFVTAYPLERSQP